jgi:hypothetical protein
LPTLALCQSENPKEKAFKKLLDFNEIMYVYSLNDFKSFTEPTKAFREDSENVTSPKVVCYVNNNQILKFESGPIGGWDQLTGVVIAKLESCPVCKDKCVFSKTIGKNLSFTNGLKLGLTKQVVETLLGIPDRKEGDKNIYEKSKKVILNESGKKRLGVKYRSHYQTYRYEIKYDQEKVIFIHYENLISDPEN